MTVRLLKFLGAVVALSFMVPGAAGATDWLRAESPHFVVYSSGGEAELRANVRTLEDFDDLLRKVHNLPADAPTTRKLDLYLVSGPGELGEVRPNMVGKAYGFYSASLGDIFAVGIRSQAEDRDDTVLHEYVHHFMMQNYLTAYPAWLVEGYAEYFMTAELTPTVREVGRYNQERANTLANFPWIRVRDLLNKRPRELGPREGGVYYAQAWLLTHYMMSDPARRQALGRYLAALGKGTSSMQTWTDTVGDDEIGLEKKLKAHFRASLAGVNYPRARAFETEMSVSRMPKSADRLLLLGLRARGGGAPPADQPKLIDDIRREAARYPDDRLARLALAQVEVGYGDLSAGLAVLDAMLKSDPNDVEALRLAAYAHLRRVEDAKNGRAAVDEDRTAGLALLTRAFKLRPDDYQVLYNYARIQAGTPGYPSDNAVNALLRAVELAPQVDAIRVAAGEALITKQRGPEAIDVLTPVANNPHGGGFSPRAQALIARASGSAPP